MNLSSILDKHPDLNHLLWRLCSCHSNCNGRVYLIGGAVRDLITNPESVNDLDIAVTACDPFEYASSLEASTFANGIKSDTVYGTSKLVVEHKDILYQIDINHTRIEQYEFPGSLPEVKWVDSLFFDVSRRDFSVNALAMSLNKDSYGEVLDYNNGIEDIEDRQLRILHEKSFLEDPIRILRALRYSARMNFQIEKKTDCLLKTAIMEQRLDTVSSDRIFDELVKGLSEDCSHLYFNAYEASGLFNESNFDTGPLERFENSSEILNTWKIESFDLLLFKILLLKNPLFLRYNMPRNYRNRLSSFIDNESAWIAEILSSDSDLQLYGILSKIPDESAAALAFSDEFSSTVKLLVGRYFTAIKCIKPILTGRELLALGVPEGKQIGLLLKELKERKIQGQILDTRESEIKYIEEKLGRNKYNGLFD